MEYGDPEGSLLLQSLDSSNTLMLFNEKNRVYMFSFILLMLLTMPAVVFFMYKEEQKYHENGIDKRSDDMMAGALFDFMDRNQRKNIKQLTNDQWVEIMEMSLEFI